MKEENKLRGPYDDVIRSPYDVVNEISAEMPYWQVARYIGERHKGFFSEEEATKFAHYLIDECEFKKAEIMLGDADAEIDEYRSYMEVKQESVSHEKEQVGTKLRTTKKKVNKVNVKKMMASLLLVASISAVAVKGINKLNVKLLDDDISGKLGMLATNIEEDYEHKKTIVEQNTYVANYGDGRTAATEAYDNNGIARDIIDICIKDPKLFDIVVNDVYFDMQYNRLSNMDSVFSYLRDYFSKEDAFKDLYAEIEDCEVFLEYLVKKGYTNPTDKDYYSLLQDIEIYKGLKDTQIVPFNSLDKNGQARVQKLVDNYRNSKANLNNKYRSTINNLIAQKEGR